ncbi:hypothetical protein MHYP_G00275030 [Metynnis hypsauchen]
MKPKRKVQHVVAWMSRAEWEQLLENLHSGQAALQTHALHRLSAWRGSNSGLCCAAGLGTVLRSPWRAPPTWSAVRSWTAPANWGGDDLVLLYGMALTRCVNLILERRQGKVAKSLRYLASKLNIPEWVVNLRHDMTHCNLPSLKWCRKGCEFILNWLRQQYWSRQLNGHPIQDWSFSSEEEEDEEERSKEHEEERAKRQRDIEAHKKARELLISYEREQFQVYEELQSRNSEHGPWPNATADLSWILAQIKQFSSESRDVLVGALVQDGFLIPTGEQLESLDINPSEDLLDPLTPCLPRVFLRFWFPILHCNSKSQSKAVRRMKMMKERIFVSRVLFQWQELISACLNAPCPATPFLLQQILSDMDKPLPPATQQNLLRLCSIYTQSNHGDCSPTNTDSSQPVYTLESLQERLGGATHDGHSPNHTPQSSQATMDLQECLSAETIQERNAALRGSPWSVCTDKVPWKLYPLGKVPGQSEDPSCLMAETYSTLTVFDQQMELDQIPPPHGNTSGLMQSRTGSDGPLWTHNDLSKLKAGLKLF